MILCEAWLELSLIFDFPPKIRKLFSESATESVKSEVFAPKLFKLSVRFLGKSVSFSADVLCFLAYG